jgi:hypothetical protein
LSCRTGNVLLSSRHSGRGWRWLLQLSASIAEGTHASEHSLLGATCVPRDACIKTIVDFQALLGPSVQGMTMTGLVIDGSNNPWFTLVEGATASRGNPNVAIASYVKGTLSM